MSKILCSTGALLGRSNGRDFRLIEPLSRVLECDGYEFMMFGCWYDEKEELLRFLKALRLDIPVVHCEKAIGERISAGGESLKRAIADFEVNCHIARELGASKAVIHLWNGLVSDSAFENNMSAYPALAETAENYELDLLIENVVCNVKDPISRIEELMDAYPDLKTVFDTKMAAFHSQIDMLYDKSNNRLRNSVRHYHVNDYGGGYMDWQNLRTLPIGDGKIDFGKFFDHIASVGYKDTFTVESTAYRADGSVNTDMLNRQFAFMREKLNK